MPYYKEGNITRFVPDDTEDSFYIQADYFAVELQEIIDLAREKWKDIDFSLLKISACHIQTNCIGHDRYDSWDYTNYILIEKKNDNNS